MSISFQEMKHEDNVRAEIWAVCGLDAVGWAGAKQESVTSGDGRTHDEEARG